MRRNFVRNVAIAAVAVGSITGCQQTPTQKAAAQEARTHYSNISDTWLKIPTLACSQYFGTGMLPANQLSRAGFSPVKNGYSKQIGNGSFSNPGGSRISVRTSNRGRCEFIYNGAPFHIDYAQSTIANVLIDDGWSYEGNLVYSKGSKRIKLSGSSSYGVAAISLSPV